MFDTSKAMVAAAVAALLTGALASPTPAAAQQPTTVTGCLSKGAGPGTFNIKGDDGKSYELNSKTVGLDGHVGHKVTVTGTPAGMETGAVSDTGMAGMAHDTAMAKAPGMKHDTGMAKEKEMPKEAAMAGGGTFNVTGLKHVSAECK
jgi:hypothetical protein